MSLTYNRGRSTDLLGDLLFLHHYRLLQLLTLIDSIKTKEAANVLCWTAPLLKRPRLDYRI